MGPQQCVDWRMPKKRPEVFSYLYVWFVFVVVFVLSVLLSASLLVHCGLWYLFLFGQNWNASGFLRETEIAHSAWEAVLYLNGAQLSACSSFRFPKKFLLCNRFDRTQHKLKCIVDIFYALCFQVVVVVKLPVSTPTFELEKFMGRSWWVAIKGSRIK